jgi:hypothetical protein
MKANGNKKGILLLLVLAMVLVVIAVRRPHRKIEDRTTEVSEVLDEQRSGSTNAVSAVPSPAPIQNGKAQKETEIEPGLKAKVVSPDLAIKNQLRADFQAKQEDFLRSVPTREQMRALPPGKVHFTPQVIQVAAVKLAEVAELIDKNPDLQGEGFALYRSCAENESNPNSIRASCLVEFVHLKKQRGANDQLPTVPPHIAQLAKKLI